MRLSKKAITIVVATGLLSLWLLCLPGRMFDGVPYSTVVVAADGELLGARVADDGQWRFPPCDSVPEKFATALIEYEDRTFYSHCGVSLRGLARALKQNISNGRIVSGASTITMQTIRLHRRGPRNIFEKIIEVFMATRLELTYSKAEILRLYASHAPFGGNVVGLDAARWRYFGNAGNDMSWAEAATLATMQNAPSSIHLTRNRDRLLAKRNRLLKRLYDKGSISAEDYELAVEEPLIDRPYAMPQTAPHLVEYWHRRRHGEHTLTAIDYSLQMRLEELTTQWRNELSLSGVNDLAAVVVDVASGEMVAYCGNADITAERQGRWVDIARSPRSSGSILKPLLYGAAMQEGIILDDTLLPDVPTDFGGFAPKNFDGTWSGVVEARKALALSLNVPNVWLLEEFGVARFAALLQRCGLSTLTRSADSYGLSLILGGAEVNLVDMANCYARLARFDRDFPISDSVAVYNMFDAMREVNRPDQLDLSRISSAQNIAWKTGTSYGGRDGWAIGVTPRYVVGVWVGNADGSGVADLTGARMAGPVMFDIFNLLPPSEWFDEPQGRVARVCAHSGHLAGKYCHDVRLKRVSSKGLQSRPCPYCTQLPVSLDGQRRVSDASEPMELKTYFLLPPVQKYYYKLSHADYIEPPVGNDHDGAEVRFIYPAEGAVLALPHKSDGSLSELVCKAAHTRPGAHLFWHLDNLYLGTTTDIHQVQCRPSAGVHRLSVIDEYGATETVTFVVK